MNQLASSRAHLAHAQRWVVKIGSALMTLDGQGIAKDDMSQWAAQLSQLQQSGYTFVLVSSGAVAEGMVRLGMGERPTALHELQAAAAVGQMGLIQAWESAFAKHNIRTAQVLLTHDDLSNRKRYLNARSTLKTLIDMGVIPIVNENDTVATDEIRFGDNDSLAAMVGNLIEADAVAILTDQDGLFDADPRHNTSAQLIKQVNADDESLMSMAGDGGKLGRGGMITKVLAAQQAAGAGAHTIIANGRANDVITRVVNGDDIGTLLWADEKPMAARKQWMSAHLHVQGSVVVDKGAARALIEQHTSLLPIGVKHVTGEFNRGDLIAVCDESGKELARGLCNYSSANTSKLLGLNSDERVKALGYAGDAELIHRDNLVLV